jgi:hypothetical protein
MIQTAKDLVSQWNAGHGERAKLQHAYLVVSVLGIVVAGLVGLLNYDASRALLRICFAGLGIFVINGIVWALLSGLILNRFPAQEVVAPAVRRPAAPRK